MLLAAVSLVLLIAAINVANLLLARGAARWPELATRVALGAGRWRLTRQLATEGAVIAVAGGLLGVALAALITPALGSVMAFEGVAFSTASPVGLDLAADRRVLLAASAVTMLTALVVGLVPALRLGAPRSAQSLVIGDRGRDAASSQRIMRTLLRVQFALSLLLVTAAGLLLRTSMGLSGIELGFDPGNVVLLEVADETPGASPFGGAQSAETRAQRAAAYRRVEERLNAIPGVQSASLSWYGLFTPNDLWVPLIDPQQTSDRREVRVNFVSARYFETVGMRMTRGRALNEGDGYGAQKTAVVNEALVRGRFGERDPVGAQVIPEYPGHDGSPVTIVGVVADARYNNLRETETGPMIWMPLSQSSIRLGSASRARAAGRRSRRGAASRRGTSLGVAVSDGPADLDARDAGREDGVPGAAPVQHVGGVRRVRPAARRDGAARNAGVQGRAAGTRDWRTSRTRREAVVAGLDVLSRGAHPGGHGRDRRSPTGACRGFMAAGVSVWRRAAGSTDSGCRVRRARRDGAARGIGSCASGEPSRSSGGVAE